MMAMETLKIKIEIGDRRFEADGPVSSVEGQANAFMKLVVGGNTETLAAEAAAAAAKGAAAATPMGSVERNCFHYHLIMVNVPHNQVSGRAIGLPTAVCS
jgi:hypothetical protein